MPRTRTEHCAGMVPSGTASVIDIGCGHGGLLSLLRDVPYRAGVETDADILEEARHALPDADLRKVDGGDLPFADETFDVAVLSEVLEHVGNANKVPVVGEALRVLKPGGRLIITVPHRGPLWRLDPLDFKRSMPGPYRAYRRLRGGEPKTHREIGHVPLTLSEVEALLRGRADVMHVTYGGPVSPLISHVMVALMLGGASDRIKFAWARHQDGEGSIPAPSWFAHTLRLVAVKSPI